MQANDIRESGGCKGEGSRSLRVPYVEPMCSVPASCRLALLDELPT